LGHRASPLKPGQFRGGRAGKFIPVVLLPPFYWRAIISPMQLLKRCLILGVVLASILPSEANGQTQPAPLTKSFAGCYELTLGRWWPWSFDGDNEIDQFYYYLKSITSELLTWLFGNLSAFCFKTEGYDHIVHLKPGARE